MNLLHKTSSLAAVAGVVFGLAFSWSETAATAASPQAPVADLKLPPGFSIEVWIDEVPNARTLALGDKGTLFVGSREAGKLYALTDTDGDGRPDRRIVLAEGLNRPTGLAFRNGDLFVAEIDKLWKLPGIESKLAQPPKPVTIRADLPDKTHHGWRFIDFGPDGKLYLAIGAPCNVCKPEAFTAGGDKLEFASITRMDPDGRNWEVVARGVRNSVGFGWHPKTRQLWFTENGRDMLGDDTPSCELNKVSRTGEDFGFPYCHAGTVSDPDFGKDRSCSAATAPVALLGPHVAPLGLEFYTGTQFPAEYRGDVFVALHGSWNRSQKNGYRVQRVHLDGDRVVSQEPFVEGWLQVQNGNESVSGRPADVLQAPDGSLLISDDLGGRIWRVRYTGK